MDITGDGAVTSDPAGIDCGSNCTAQFERGTRVTLTADPMAGWQFARWGGACTGTSSACDLTLFEAVTVTATFTQSGQPPSEGRPPGDEPPPGDAGDEPPLDEAPPAEEELPPGDRDDESPPDEEPPMGEDRGPVNQVPIAAFTATPDKGTAPLLVEFDSGASNDPDGRIENYRWDFGDGQAGSGQRSRHRFDVPGTYFVELTVTDDDGVQANRTDAVIVQAAYARTLLRSGARDVWGAESTFRYGGNTAIDGNTAAIAAVGGGDLTSGDGIVIFQVDGRDFRQVQHIDYGDRMQADGIAFALDISGDYLASNYRCSVDACDQSGFFIFEWQGDEFVEVAHFQAPDLDHERGTHLAFSGNYLFASASGPSFEAPFVVEVYRRTGDTWSKVDVLALEGDRHDRTWGLDASGDRLAVGHKDRVISYESQDGEWTAVHTLTDLPQDPVALAMTDNRLLVRNAQVVQLYRRSEGDWVADGELPGGHDYPAGYDAAVTDEHVLIGDTAEDVVRVYKRVAGDWLTAGTLEAGNGADQNFGTAVAATGTYAVIGADPLEDEYHEFRGAGYIMSHRDP